MGATAWVIGAVSEKGLEEARRGAGILVQGGEEGEVAADVAHEFHEAQRPSGGVGEVAIEGQEESLVEEGDHDEPRAEEDAQLGFGDVVEPGEVEVSLPGFEDALDAPAEAIERVPESLKRFIIANQSPPCCPHSYPSGLYTILLSVEAKPPHNNLRSPAP